MRSFVLFLALVSSTLPAAAQQGGHRHGAMQENVTGGGKLPAGWQARRDNKPANAELDNVRFMSMGSALHAQMGMTNAIFWNPANTAAGEYELTATFAQSKSEGMHHPEGAGLVLAGSHLEQDDQSYLYFLVRDGSFLINHRAGKDVHKIVPWTAHAAIRKTDENGRASNTLAVRVAGADVTFLVNGQVVQTLPRAQLKPDGIVGLRVNMHLDMHITDFAIKPGTR